MALYEKICKTIDFKLMKRHILFTILLWGIVSSSYSQDFILPLWPEGIPNFRETGATEKWDSSDIIAVTNVQHPEIAVFLPAARQSTGQAVLICPGGGYWALAYNWEGTDIAKWFNSKGIAGIVLKYRLPTSAGQVVPYESPLMDAKRAMRLVRYHASEWNIDPGQVGIIGFSAGGHLASTLGTHFDYGDVYASNPLERLSSRPDFMILAYPVITMTKSFMHSGSRNALIGDNPEKSLAENFSNELHVTKDTPPTFLIHAGDDKGVPVENSLVFYQALVDNNIPAEMHIYPSGGHGFSLAINKGHLITWTDVCIEWIRSLKEE
jgi:acetyl esterase/lipase